MKDKTGLQYGLCDVPITEYHADKRFHTASMYKRFNKSPALMNCKSEPTSTAFSVGTITHALALDDAKQLKRIHAYDGVRRGKAYQDWKLSLPDDAIECTQADWDTAFKSADALSRDETIGALLREDGLIESTICWFDEWDSDGHAVKQDCKMRPDFLIPSKRIIVDIKTTATFSERDLLRSIVKYGYHIQLAHYTTGAAFHFDVPLHHVKFVFAFVETKEPWRTAAIMLDDTSIEESLDVRCDIQQAYLKAREQQEFVDPLTNKITVLSLPEWAFHD